MNWYKISSKKSYIGNCVNCLEDKWFNNNISSDATELAQIIDNGITISFDQFKSLCLINEDVIKSIQHESSRYLFFINTQKQIAWIYDSTLDIHYFYY